MQRPPFYPLSDALRAFNAKGAGLTYQRLWTAAIEGRIPAQRMRKRWIIRREDMAEAFQTLTKG